MGLPAVEVRRERHDQYAGPPAPTVTVRALRLPPGELLPLVAPRGRLVVIGAPPSDHPGLVAEDWSLPDIHVRRRT
jgi:hypothetical protein